LELPLAKHQKIVLASSNLGKIKEFSALLAPLNIEIILQSELGIPDAEETGLTFVENALIKARHAAKLSGLPALADDSGLAVRALQGAPGIYSARYAGEQRLSHENIEKLLSTMRDVPDDERQAEFICVLAFLSTADDPIPLICQGTWQGSILHAPRGSNGFGYDPVFYVPSENKASAELTAEHKNKISHRAKALATLATSIAEKL
jgi:XTP/dITP diphosphohydrolase